MSQANRIVYIDQGGRPLMAGTAIEDSTSFVKHQGLIAYDQLGQQLVLENSLRFGRAVAIEPILFNGGKSVNIVRAPRSLLESQAIMQRAWRDVELGVKWTVFDNCQDFISRSYTGKNGSKTRDGVVLTGLAAAFCALLVA